MRSPNVLSDKTSIISDVCYVDAIYSIHSSILSHPVTIDNMHRVFCVYIIYGETFNAHALKK